MLENISVNIPEFHLDFKSNMINEILDATTNIIEAGEYKIIRALLCDGLENLKSILNENQNKKWMIRSDMFIPVNKHLHTSILDFDPSSSVFKFTFRDDETFKIPRLSVYKILAILTINPEEALDDEVTTKKLIDESYNHLYKEYFYRDARDKLSPKDHKINPKFINEVCESIFKALEKEFKSLYAPFSEMNLSDRIAVLPAYENVPIYDVGKLIYLFNSTNQSDEIRLKNKIEFKMKIKSWLSENKNGALDFFCNAYFQTYNCGHIEFRLDTNGFMIHTGKSNASNNMATNYLLNFIYSLSQNNDRTAMQASLYDIKFSGLKKGVKTCKPSPKVSEYSGEKNFPFPFILD